MNKYVYNKLQNCKSSINVSEQLPCNEITFVSFCGQYEVMPSKSKTVAVTVVIWEELLQDMMMAVHAESCTQLGFNYRRIMSIQFVL